jgi:two-component sensor histidine kinase
LANGQPKRVTGKNHQAMPILPEQTLAMFPFAAMICMAWCRNSFWAFLPFWAMVALPAHAQPNQAPEAMLTQGWADTTLIIPRSHANPRIPIDLSTQPQASYIGLSPATHTLYLRSLLYGKPWLEAATTYILQIVPRWWQTTWFRIMLIILGIAFIAELFVLRLNALRKKDREQAEVKMRMMELQDSALRAQMNPHFIFNCLNSIKSLVQEGKNDNAVAYLTTFTKLIRSLLQHADKRYVTAYEELETCRLYLDLEALRFSGRFSYHINTEPSLDLKSVEVPTLVIQPIVENAIWHGLIPKEGTGHLWIEMRGEGERLVCVVDDDGIGREASRRMKQHKAGHVSKGVSLTHDRIDLYNLLKGNDATMDITDKSDAEGKPSGTRVTITFLMH